MGEPVVVEGSQVACGEPLGCLDCELCPLVEPGEILEEVHAEVTEWGVRVFWGRKRDWVALVSMGIVLVFV